MVTQAQRGNPDFSATEAPHPGNHVALIAGAALAAILAVLGVLPGRVPFASDHRFLGTLGVRHRQRRRSHRYRSDHTR
jgi:hypothetical protein